MNRCPQSEPAAASLDGLWDFAFLGAVDPDSVDLAALVFDDCQPVPGCFDASPAYAGQRGLAAYRTRLFLPDASPHRLVFEAVHHWCRVFLAGRQLCEHSGGFTRFSCDISGHTPGPAEMVVLVDNRFDVARSPLHHEYFDWYHYGGITRPVTLRRLGDLWIDDLQLVTTRLDPPALQVSLHYAAVGVPGLVELSFTVDDQPMLAETLQLTESAGVIERTLVLPGAALWSPAAPELHQLHACLATPGGPVCAGRRERFGLRQIQVAGRAILLNGAPLRLLGVNRHETHPQFGHALPLALLTADIHLLRDLGCNFVRGSHYPQDPRFLDLCDQAGICVWVEATGWQHTAAHLTDPHFLAAQQANIEAMVAMARNHPSVILWGVLNESHSHDPACRPGYAALLAHLRALDPTRPLTYACNHPFDDLCLDLVDVVSINCYPGWYHGELPEIPAFLDFVVSHLDSTGQAEKPLLISEIGAGAIYGWRDAHQTRWSEQYQADLLETVIRHLFIDRDRCSGLAIWQFCDCRTSQRVATMLGRPRGFNNKGIVDEYRRPKQAYTVVRRYFQQLGASEPAVVKE